MKKLPMWLIITMIIGGLSLLGKLNSQTMSTTSFDQHRPCSDFGTVWDTCGLPGEYITISCLENNVVVHKQLPYSTTRCSSDNACIQHTCIRFCSTLTDIGCSVRIGSKTMTCTNDGMTLTTKKIFYKDCGRQGTCVGSSEITGVGGVCVPNNPALPNCMDGKCDRPLETYANCPFDCRGVTEPDPATVCAGVGYSGTIAGCEVIDGGTGNYIGPCLIGAVGTKDCGGQIPTPIPGQCVSNSQLLGFISQWVSNQLSNTELLSKISQWVSC